MSGLTIPVVTTVQWADDAPYDIPAAVKALESDFDDDGRRVDPDTLSASAEHQSSAWDGVSPAGADTLRTDLDSRSGTTSIALLAVGAQDVERLAGAILLEPPL